MKNEGRKWIIYWQGSGQLVTATICIASAVRGGGGGGDERSCVRVKVAVLAPVPNKPTVSVDVK